MTDAVNHADRAHAMLSASSSARWLACPPSAVAATLYANQDTAYTREGTLAHEVAEMVVAGTWPIHQHDPDVTREMVECAESYRDYIQELIKSPDAVVLLEQRLDFSDWVPDGFGTGDCLILQGTHLDVVDYKYGQGVTVSAEGNSQMRLYGLGALCDFGRIYDIETVTLHIFQPRKDHVSTETLTASELVLWGDSIKETALTASKGEGAPCAGPGCRFCPHAGACPTLAIACLDQPYSAGSVDAVASLSPSAVAEILALEPMITAWLRAVKDRALASLMDGDAIPGYKVVAGRASRGWADDLEVAALLERAGYKREQYTKTELLSPAALEKALGKKAVVELLGGQVLSYPGAPTVAPDSDPRPVFDRVAEAKNDFK